MRTVIEHVHNGNFQWSKSFQQKIDIIHENIHWMFLIAGTKLWLVLIVYFILSKLKIIF